MTKESPIIKILDFIVKHSIYLLVFLLPLFFLPQTTDILDFNKQNLLLLLVFISFLAYMLKVFLSGRLETKKSFLHIFAGILFLVYLLATIFSVYTSGSFWGQPQQFSESMISVACFVLLYFLVSNVFSKKDIFLSAMILSVSACIAQVVGLLQLCGLYVIPFDFARSAAFNTIGSAGSLGIFSAILLPLAIVLMILTKRWWRFLFFLEIILSAAVLLVINYPLVWWVVAIEAVAILIIGLVKKDLFDGRLMILPVFFFAISLFFLFVNPQINLLPQKTNEIFLSQQAGFDISMKAINESAVFGTGPATFDYDFLKFKSPDFSKTSLWNAIFNKSSSKVLGDVATIGIAGFLSLLAIMVLPIIYGAGYIFKKNSAAPASASQNYKILSLGLLAGLIGESAGYFIYNSNITLDFIFFFSIAALVAIISEHKKEFALKLLSLRTILVILVFVIIFILGLGIIILAGQRYIAEVYYANGVADYQNNQKDQGLESLERAASLNPGSDLYYRQLSRAYLMGLQDEVQNASAAPSDQEKTKINTLTANAINAAKIATDLNPKNADNWSARGYIYQSLFGVSGDSATWAISSYDSALKLDPNNPYLFTQEGNIYLTEAMGLPADQVGPKNQLLARAQARLEKAVALNPNYTDALYSLGLVYDSLGQKDNAINIFTQLQKINPQNTQIHGIINNLQAGRGALEAAPPAPAVPPKKPPVKK